MLKITFPKVYITNAQNMFQNIAQKREYTKNLLNGSLKVPDAAATKEARFVSA